MYPFYLGIDLHLKRTYMVLMNHTGEVIDERRITNNEIEEYLVEFVPKDTHAVLEATRNWAFMYDHLSQHVERVDLAHPKELKAISAAAVKADHIDAKVLANLARLDFLPTSYAAPKEIRDLRMYNRHRDQLVRMRTQVKNRIHAILASYNLVPPASDLFGIKGREYLEEVMETKLRLAAKKVIHDQLFLIDELSKQIETIEAETTLSPEQKQMVRLLKTVPGIGKVTATTIIAEIGDIHRFHSAKALCNWAGLTPKIHSSDVIVRHGRISKQGSSLLRGAMTRAATVASRSSKRWYVVHENLVPHCGKQAAKVAVARRLLTVIYHMLKRNEPYQGDYRRNSRGTGEPDLLHGSLKPTK
ncbi:IS110 family transposase [Chloroflexota bacterium]